MWNNISSHPNGKINIMMAAGIRTCAKKILIEIAKKWRLCGLEEATVKKLDLKPLSTMVYRYVLAMKRKANTPKFSAPPVLANKTLRANVHTPFAT